MLVPPLCTLLRLRTFRLGLAIRWAESSEKIFFEDIKQSLIWTTRALSETSVLREEQPQNNGDVRGERDPRIETI
jgi:hypothetical protein